LKIKKDLFADHFEQLVRAMQDSPRATAKTAGRFAQNAPTKAGK